MYVFGSSAFLPSTTTEKDNRDVLQQEEENKMSKVSSGTVLLSAKGQTNPLMFEQALVQWFEQLAKSAAESIQERDRNVGASPYTLLCTQLMNSDIDTSQPLCRIRQQCTDIAQNDSKGVVAQFCRQWDEYYDYLYGANTVKIAERMERDREWFNDRVCQITFETVFSNELWNATQRDRKPFTTMVRMGILATLSTQGKRKREEEGLEDLDIKLPVDKTIMRHVHLRQARVKVQVYRQIYSNWMQRHSW